MRLFDVQEARRLVPVLSTAFNAIRDCLERLQQSRRQLASLGESAEPGAAGESIPRAHQLQSDCDALIAQVRQEVANLEELGVEVKSFEGLVDFRALRKGRQVYLCWQLGEPTVMYWHELDGGFRGRRAIDDASAFARSYLS